MVVDAGQISTLTSASVNQRIPITQYTGTQLAAVGTNGVSWSAFTWLNNNTLFVTRPRASVNSQTVPWPDATSPVQAGTVGRMVTIPPGALDELTLLVYPVSTATAVVEEDSSAGNPNYTTGVSYHDALAGAYGGQFNGTFAGNPENTTLNNFTTAGAVIRSDFYQMAPTSGPGYVPGTWLGYFELSTNGAMTYVAYPISVPVTKSISRTGNTSTINYTTGTYGTYTLRGTNDLTAPIATWPPIATLTSGNNSVHTITDTTTDSARFYIITAQ
jgi:hypothetical protein